MKSPCWKTSKVSPSQPHKKMTRWEYMTVRFADDGPAKVDLQEIADNLNSCGRDGWELISTESLTGLHGQAMYLLALLKRPNP